MQHRKGAFLTPMLSKPKCVREAEVFSILDLKIFIFLPEIQSWSLLEIVSLFSQPKDLKLEAFTSFYVGFAPIKTCWKITALTKVFAWQVDCIPEMTTISEITKTRKRNKHLFISIHKKQFYTLETFQDAFSQARHEIQMIFAKIM